LTEKRRQGIHSTPCQHHQLGPDCQALRFPKTFISDSGGSPVHWIPSSTRLSRQAQSKFQPPSSSTMWFIPYWRTRRPTSPSFQ
jgi:hypothetical protein